MISQSLKPGWNVNNPRRTTCIISVCHEVFHYGRHGGDWWFHFYKSWES